jgi:hypothetical protein
VIAIVAPFSADLISAEFKFRIYTKSQQKISKKTSEIFADFSADVAVRWTNPPPAVCVCEHILFRLFLISAVTFFWYVFWYKNQKKSTLINPLPPGEKPHIGDYFRFEITFGKRGVCAN